MASVEFAAHEVKEGREGGFATFAHGDDNLLVGDVGDVAGGIDAFDRRTATAVDFNLAGLVAGLHDIDAVGETGHVERAGGAIDGAAVCEHAVHGVDGDLADGVVGAHGKCARTGAERHGHVEVSVGVDGSYGVGGVVAVNLHAVRERLERLVAGVGALCGDFVLIDAGVEDLVILYLGAFERLARLVGGSLGHELGVTLRAVGVDADALYPVIGDVAVGPDILVGRETVYQRNLVRVVDMAVVSLADIDVGATLLLIEEHERGAVSNAESDTAPYTQRLI